MTMLQRVASGQDYAQMAAELQMPEATVKSRLKRLRDELGAKNNPHMIAIAYERGILKPHKRG